MKIVKIYDTIFDISLYDFQCSCHIPISSGDIKAAKLFNLIFNKCHDISSHISQCNPFKILCNSLRYYLYYAKKFVYYFQCDTSNSNPSLAACIVVVVVIIVGPYRHHHHRHVAVFTNFEWFLISGNSSPTCYMLRYRYIHMYVCRFM